MQLVPIEDTDPVEPGSEPTSQHDTPQSGLQRPRRLVVAWLAAICAYIFLVPSGLVGQEASVFISDLAWTTAALLATISCLRAAMVSPGRERLAWLLFAAACGAWTLGQFAWNIYEIFLSITVPFPSLADVGYLAFGPLMIAGLLVLRTTQRERGLTWLRIANLGLILSGIAVLLIVTLTQPFLRAQFPLAVSLIVVGESASITIAFILSLYVLWSYRWGLRLGPVALLTLALALHTISGLFYTRELVTARYDVNSVYNFLWLAAFALMQWSAESQVTLTKSTDASLLQTVLEKQGWVEAVVPAVLLLCMACTAIALGAEVTPQVVHFGSIILALFAVVLAIREGMLYRYGMQIREQWQHASTALAKSRTQLQQFESGRLQLQRDIEVMARAGAVGLWDWDLASNRVRFTREWKHQLGYEEHEISDEVEEWRTRLHPEDVERVTKALQTYLDNPVGEFSAEQRLRHRDGSYRWILAHGSLITDDAGKPQRMLGSHVDITESKNMEISLRQSETRYRELVDTLELRVNERTRELTEAYRESQSFAYAVAHDLKAPLRAIDGFSHLLEQSASERLNASEQAYIKRVRHGALHMASLIDGLLAYSRLEHRELRFGPINARELVEEVVKSMEAVVHPAQAIINITLPPLTVCADMEGLRIVIRNLMDNALKFASPSRTPQVEIGGYDEAECVVISVRDNGIGFDPQYHDKIFEIFNRLHSSGYEGTGMGLALVRKAVHRMHGRIWAESAPDRGAVFYVRLPRASTTGAVDG